MPQISALLQTQIRKNLNLSPAAGTNAQAPTYRRQQGACAVPVLRYFLVIGCCLLGLLFAADYLVPNTDSAPAQADAATASNGGSLASWRQSQQNLTKSRVAAVVYPDIAPMAPTAERLQFERQMTYRRADAVPQEPKSAPVYEAKAEMVDVGAAAVTAPKPAKIARHKTVAHRDRPPNNYAAAYPPAPISQFGGYRQAQYDRPSNGWFTGFRMF
jgi:hypothetical protein